MTGEGRRSLRFGASRTKGIASTSGRNARPFRKSLRPRPETQACDPCGCRTGRRAAAQARGARRAARSRCRPPPPSAQRVAWSGPRHLRSVCLSLLVQKWPLRLRVSRCRRGVKELRKRKGPRPAVSGGHASAGRSIPEVSANSRRRWTMPHRLTRSTGCWAVQLGVNIPNYDWVLLLMEIFFETGY